MLLAAVPDLTTAPLTVDQAERLTAEIRRDLGSAIVGLRRAREGTAHLVLGYATWHEYCEDRFGNLADLALPVTERRALVASMKETGLSNRPVAERLGVSAGTVSGDVAELRRSGWTGEPDTVTSRDGSVRSARSLRTAPQRTDYTGLSRVSETAARVAAHGARGLTSIELDRETGWPMGTATGNLSVLERRGWLVRVDDLDRRRQARAPYVVTDLGAAEIARRLAR